MSDSGALPQSNFPRRYGDNPIENAEADRLGRVSSVSVLWQLLEDQGLETPIAVGIFGEWGSGKSSVMKMIYNGLQSDHIKLWFEAWQYSHQNEALWRALLLSLVNSIRDHTDQILDRKGALDREKAKVTFLEELDELSVSLYRSREYEKPGDVSINWRAAVPLVLRTAADFAPVGSETLKKIVDVFGEGDKTTELIEQERVKSYRERIQSLEQFQTNLQRLVKEYVLIPTQANRNPRLFVFIDDLDRCLPEAAVSALEALKLFLQIEGCVFVLGMDRDVVQQGIRIRYGDIEAKAFGKPVTDSVYVNPTKYLDKIIQIPFTLPPLGRKQIEAFVKDWYDFHQRQEFAGQAAEVIVAGVAANPRSVKRTLNVLSLVWDLRNAQRGQDADPKDLALLTKIVVLQTSYEEQYRSCVERPSFLKTLEADALSSEPSDQSRNLFQRYPPLREMLRSSGRFTELQDQQLNDIIFLTRVSDTVPLEGTAR